MSIHAGEIPIQDIVRQLADYLQSFRSIVELYRFWSELPFREESLPQLLEGVPKRHFEKISGEVAGENCRNVYQSHNVATRYATHEMRSYRTAFDLLDRINHGFQKMFPLS